MTDPGQPVRERGRAAGRGHGATKWVIFALVMVLVIAWVAVAGAEHDSVARSFLRNLMRALR